MSKLLNLPEILRRPETSYGTLIQVFLKDFILAFSPWTIYGYTKTREVGLATTPQNDIDKKCKDFVLQKQRRQTDKGKFLFWILGFIQLFTLPTVA